jgi:hypothetical protein
MSGLLWSAVILGYAYSVWQLGKVWREPPVDEPLARHAKVVHLRRAQQRPRRPPWGEGNRQWGS